MFREMQVIQLDKLVQLIDTPGVVLAQSNKMDAVEVTLFLKNRYFKF